MKEKGKREGLEKKRKGKKGRKVEGDKRKGREKGKKRGKVGIMCSCDFSLRKTPRDTTVRTSNIK